MMISAALLTPLAFVNAGETWQQISSTPPAELATDEGVQAATLDVSRAVAQFRASPNLETLLSVHLACRDLKSQLFRYRSYFGTAATHELKDTVLPVIEAALTVIKTRQDIAILESKRVRLALQEAEGCRLVLVAERLR